MPDPLPIDEALPAIADALRVRRAVVVTAAPGAGKTTRVPPALVEDGAVLLLQPRRVAARAIARRIAEERGWTLGDDVGWHVRFDRRASARTRLLVATEGVLTALARRDPLLSDFRTIVLDEFHERSVHADLGLAFATQAWRARTDLRLVVMSATIETARLSDWLDGCPIVSVPGRLYPVTIHHQPGTTVVDAAREAASSSRGAVLCFLPGAADIERARAAIAGAWPVFPLHGGLDADTQEAALRPAVGPRIVLATNLAETTVTVPDVTTVIDSGLHKVARYDSGRGIDALVTERIPQDAADQRAGRAGRTAAGRVVRLWDSRDRLRPHREPELQRVDLAGPALDVLSWGADPRTFAWFEAPPPHAIDAALALLRQLGAVDRAGRVTPEGQRLSAMPLHPRLARLCAAAGGSLDAARVCVALSDGRRLPAAAAGQLRDSDLDALLDGVRGDPGVERAARDLATSVGRGGPAGDLRRAAFEAFADRLARRREAGRDVFLLAGGTGAVLGRESGVRAADWIVAIDVATDGRPGVDPWIRMASAVDPAWITPTESTVAHEVDGQGRVRAVRRDRIGAIVLHEETVAADPVEAARVLREAWRAAPRRQDDRRLEARLRCAGLPADLDALADLAVQGRLALADVRLADALDASTAAALRRLAPETVRVPSGRDLPLEYREDGSVVVSVKLQEVFGLAESPRVGAPPVPITFELLAPNHRPVQVTRDLRSFWTRGYPEVRKELRGRYPKHPWPDDPWTAVPTHRTRRRVEPQ